MRSNLLEDNCYPKANVDVLCIQPYFLLIRPPVGAEDGCDLLLHTIIFAKLFPLLQGFPRCPSDQFNSVVTRTMGIFDVEEVGTISFRELLTTFALAMSGVSVK